MKGIKDSTLAWIAGTVCLATVSLVGSVPAWAQGEKRTVFPPDNFHWQGNLKAGQTLEVINRNGEIEANSAKGDEARAAGDRFGRLVVFLARSFRGRSLHGLGVDEQTSVIVTPDLKGKVYGPGTAYLLLVDHPAEVLEKGKPLTFWNLKVWKFTAGEAIDFAHRPTNGFRTLDVVEGKLSADPY